MTLSQIAAVLGLDETDGVTVVPLTDEAIAAATRAQPTRPRHEKSAPTVPRRKKRHLTRGK